MLRLLLSKRFKIVFSLVYFFLNYLFSFNNNTFSLFYFGIIKVVILTQKGIFFFLSFELSSQTVGFGGERKRRHFLVSFFSVRKDKFEKLNIAQELSELCID
jgi:hypothetical protein